MIDRKLIEQFALEKAEEIGCFLVDVTVSANNEIVVEIDNEDGVGIDSCAIVSKYIEEHLDRNEEDFELEVGSSGLTAPFKVLRQYQKNIGNEIEVLLKEGKKMVGVLSAADEKGIVLTISKKVKPEGAKRPIMVDEELSYTFEEIKSAKYLIRFK